MGLQKLLHDFRSFSLTLRPRESRHLKARHADGRQPFSGENIILTEKSLSSLEDFQALVSCLALVTVTNGVLAPDAINSSILRAVSQLLASHQQSQIKLVLLAAGLVRFPAAHVENCRLAPD